MKGKLSGRLILSDILSFRKENGEKSGVAVCSKSLSHLGDQSLRFIEWIEVLRALGVEKIILSVLSVHSNVMKASIINI